MTQLNKAGRAETTVAALNTAATMKSGSLPVFATPALIALMEEAAVNALDLRAGETSVGVLVHVAHTAATPVGMRVWAEAKVTGQEGRKLFFHVSAADERGPVGEGRHERVIVSEADFLAKARNKPGA